MHSFRYDHVALSFLLASDLPEAIDLIQQLVQLKQADAPEWRRVVGLRCTSKESHPLNMEPSAVQEALRLLKQHKLLNHIKKQWKRGSEENYSVDASSPNLPLDPFRVQIFQTLDAMDSDQVNALASAMQVDTTQVIEVHLLQWILNGKSQELAQLMAQTKLNKKPD